MPHGTCVAHNDTTPTFGRSLTDFTRFGFPGLTAISIWLRANVRGDAFTLPETTSLSMFARSADANTSAGAPPWICVTSADDDAELRLTVVPGCFRSNFVFISANASVSEAASATVMLPASFGFFW